MSICVYLFVCAPHVCGHPWRPERGVRPLALELQAVVRLLIGLPGSKLQSSRSSENFLNCRAIPPVHYHLSFKNIYLIFRRKLFLLFISSEIVPNIHHQFKVRGTRPLTLQIILNKIWPLLPVQYHTKYTQGNIPKLGTDGLKCSHSISSQLESICCVNYAWPEAQPHSLGVTASKKGQIEVYLMKKLEGLSSLLFYRIDIVRFDSPLLKELKLHC